MDIQQPHLRPILIKVASLAIVASVSLVGCNLPDTNTPPAIDEVVAATLTSMAPQQSQTEPSEPPAPTPTASPSPAPTNEPATATNPPPTAAATEDSDSNGEGIPGVISGSLSYPSEQIPRLAVVFFNLDDGSWWWIGTAVNQASYQMTVPVGRYHVVAYAEGGIAGGYSAAVPCGLTVACNDHSLLTVQVGSNERVTGIDVTDWYAPSGAFPSKPGGIDYP